MLTDQEDAYGHEIYDHLLGESSREIVERIDGYIDLSSGPSSYFTTYKQWQKYERQAARYIRGRVLDIGCGAGRVLLYAQERGLDCLGIDISPLAIKTCKKRGVKKAKVMSITQVSSKLGEFDTIAMFGNNFGLFGNFKRARWMLRRFYKMTSAQGRIIAISGDVSVTDNLDHLAYQKYNLKQGRMAGQLRLRVRYKKYISPWFDYLIVSPDEMKQILDGTGWEVKKIFDSGIFPYAAIIEKQ